VGSHGLGKVSRSASQRAADAVGDMRIAAVQDFGKRVVHERDELRWDLFLHKQECIVIGRNLHVLNLPAHRVSNLSGCLWKREQTLAGQLVQLADMSIVGERDHGNVGDSLGIDERLPHVAAHR